MNTGLYRELLRITALTLWVVVVNWSLQSYIANESAADAALSDHLTAKELAQRYAGQLDGLHRPRSNRLSRMQGDQRLSPAALEQIRATGEVLHITPGSSIAQTADAVDYAVRRIGLAFVALADLPPDRFYHLSLALLQRGYTRQEVAELAQPSAEKQASLLANPRR